ncbi:DNA-(apurinic or apyrimidinic site) lyase [Fopius arisanus]|uniref:DNA-(apurinic or apyrimidinic site) endonuclease n=1 Tax=Fopius arisanus TaxID=64838 RepID=A0A9R1SY88_9HYME|nr:PREDICTED: DNA-(apurinic or apyrimidinic site) lyase [Fopius arisanus]
MGNSLASSRIISLIKIKSILPRLNWRLPNKLPDRVSRELVPVSKVTALIPYNMPPNRGRVTKAASKSKPEVENNSNDEGDSDAAEMAVDVKKSAAKGKKKPSPKENGNDEKVKPTRGRKKAEVQEDDQEVPEPPKASARGRKKAAPVEDTSEDIEPKKTIRKKKEAPKAVESEPEDEPPKKASRGRKKAEVIENGDQPEEPKSRGRKKAEAAEPPQESSEKKPSRGRKKNTNESSEEPEEPDKTEKPKRGKKGKLDAVEEALDDESEEKLPAKRGRKAAVKPPEDGEDDEEKPAKRGRKPKGKEVKEPKEKAPKSAKAKRDDTPDEDEEPSVKKSKTEEKKKINKTDTNLEEIDFGCDKTNAKGNKFNVKICSWNVGGIRSIGEKKGRDYCLREDADIIVMQETKCTEKDLPETWDLPGYKRYYSDSEKAGYAGVALFTKEEPLSVKVGLETSPCNDEGRIITAEFDGFYLVAVYVPNAGRGLVTLPKRLEWNTAFKNYVKELDEKKPVIICGDMNVAHEEIDLANPKTNTKHAGFTKEEREGMTDFLGAGFVDTFRKFYPDQTGAYTFWSYMGGARSRNVGWRLDYFIVSERIKDDICDNVMRSQVYGSDHCPIVLFANL